MKWISIGFKLIPFIMESIKWVEKFVTKKGTDKQDAAVSNGEGYPRR